MKEKQKIERDSVSQRRQSFRKKDIKRRQNKLKIFEGK